MNNIFLTGDKQIGKSTIINRFLAEYNGKVCGFKTLLENEPYRKFYIESINPQITTAEKVYISKKTEEGFLKGNIEGFDSFGVEILNDCLCSSPDLIVLDELGLFESEAIHFQELVHSCLDAKTPVLGVLKAKSSPFLDSIRYRNDVTIYNVTLENREELYEIISKMISQMSQGPVL